MELFCEALKFPYIVYVAPLHLFTPKILERTLLNATFMLKTPAGSYATLDTDVSLMLLGKAHVHF